MALKKNITLDNGVVLQYHRIVSLHKITNDSNIIEVGSYVSQNTREEEPEKEVCVRRKNYETNYNEQFLISDAYDYLKTLEEYEGAKDC